MTIDTKGFLLTNKKNPFQIYRVIKAALTEDMMQVTNSDSQIDLWWHNEKKFTCPNCEIKDFSEMMEITFKYKGENRRLCVFLDCDSDYSECRAGKKIILSLGCWGSSVHLMEVCLKAIQKEFKGQAFMDDNDCDDVDWRQV